MIGRRQENLDPSKGVRRDKTDHFVLVTRVAENVADLQRYQIRPCSQRNTDIIDYVDLPGRNPDALAEAMIRNRLVIHFQF